MPAFDRSQLKKNFLSGPAASGLGALLMAIAYPVFLRKLGYETYGIWICLTIVISMSQVGNLGMSQALVRRVAEHHEKSQDDEVDKYCSTALFSISASVALLLSLLLVFHQPVLRLLGLNAQQSVIYSHLAKGVFTLSAATVVIEVVASPLSGAGRIDLYNYVQLITQATSLSFAILFLNLGLRLDGMLLSQSIGSLLGLTVALLFTIRQFHRCPFRSSCFSIPHFRQLIGQGSLLASAWLLSLVFHPINKIALGHFGHLDQLPIYEISVNLSMRLRNLFESAQRALMPEVSRLLGAQNFTAESVSTLLRKSVKSLITVALPVFAVVAILIVPLTRMWLKHAYNPAVPLGIRIFLFGAFASLIGTPFYYALIGAGRAQAVFFANGVQLLIDIAGLALAWKFLRSSSSESLYLVLAIASIGLATSSIMLFRSVNKLTRELASDHVSKLVAA